MKMSIKLAALTALLLSAQSGLFGQSEAGASPIGYGQWFSYGLLALAIVVITAAIIALFQLLNIMIKIQQIKIYEEAGMEAFLEESRKPRTNLWASLYERMTRVVPVEKEEDILMDHNYDGIKELDNRLPPWWVALFYVTIIFAVAYMTYYHFAGLGMSSAEAYTAEMQRAEEQTRAFLARQTNSVDENTVVLLTDEHDLATGANIFMANCVACHGALGEGGIGPNLTDEFWLHGGGVKDVFRTVKYGVIEKGMTPWKALLRPVEMQQVASYVMSLQGTDPPNAKEPQGEKYVPKATDTEAPAEEETMLGLAGE